jgi:hypothetical protein
LADFTTLDGDNGNIGDPLSLHLYLYANADPVNHFDPTGQESLTEVQTVQVAMITVTAMATALVLANTHAQLEMPFRFNHYTQWAFVTSILANGVNNPFGGKNYVTTDLYFSRSEAKAKLALAVKPQVFINFLVFKNRDYLLDPNPVTSKNGETGGGSEYSTDSQYRW